MVSEYIDRLITQPGVFVPGYQNRFLRTLVTIQVTPVLLRWNQDLVHDYVPFSISTFLFPLFERPYPV
jgi:hypothetical protein